MKTDSGGFRRWRGRFGGSFRRSLWRWRCRQMLRPGGRRSAAARLVILGSKSTLPKECGVNVRLIYRLRCLLLRAFLEVVGIHEVVQKPRQYLGSIKIQPYQIEAQQYSPSGSKMPVLPTSSKLLSAVEQHITFTQLYCSNSWRLMSAYFIRPVSMSRPCWTSPIRKILKPLRSSFMDSESPY